MTELALATLVPEVKKWLEEDDLLRNYHYTKSLPETPVTLELKIKSPLILAGTDFFKATFCALGASSSDFSFLSEYEGKKLKAGEILIFPKTLPFSLAVTGERLALNLLQHASSIATWTHEFVTLAKDSGVKILDTRKTTPGLRALEKYAVRVGGGYNHRLGQTDLWMIKDNHKTCLGGLRGAVEFFESQGAFYNNIIAEIHDLNELQMAIDMKISNVMLDNFSAEKIKEAVKIKPAGMTYEVSGGVKITNIKDYLIPGVDVISIGALTNAAPRVDISLKFKPHERL